MPVDELRAAVNGLMGRAKADLAELVAYRSGADLLWARPSATVIGIDVPHVIGSSAAVQASAAARVSLRLPPGVTGQAAQEALVEHLQSRVPWGLHCEISRVAMGDPFIGSLHGPA